ncbi:hypothetical protein DFH06DRAFT_1307107 [Mycena polygramma]|nr:hypothetical protein DFH06DRAFT_1307107 [Mycena polygramma]
MAMDDGSGLIRTGSSGSIDRNIPPNVMPVPTTDPISIFECIESEPKAGPKKAAGSLGCLIGSSCTTKRILPGIQWFQTEALFISVKRMWYGESWVRARGNSGKRELLASDGQTNRNDTLGTVLAPVSHGSPARLLPSVSGVRCARSDGLEGLCPIRSLPGDEDCQDDDAAAAAWTHATSRALWELRSFGAGKRGVAP